MIFKTKHHRRYQPATSHPGDSYVQQPQITNSLVDLDLTSIVTRDLTAFLDDERPRAIDTQQTNEPLAGDKNPVSSNPSSLNEGSSDPTTQNLDSADTQDHPISHKLTATPAVLVVKPVQTPSPNKIAACPIRPKKPLVYSLLAFNIPDSTDLIDVVTTLGKVANVKSHMFNAIRVPKRIQAYPAPVRFTSVDQPTLESLVSKLSAIRTVPYLSNIYFSRLLARPYVSVHPKTSAASILGAPCLPIDPSRNGNPTYIPDRLNEQSFFVDLGRKLSVIPPQQAFNLFLNFLRSIQT
ncbi:unnamed protein product [Dicrocoelium dendriticum]|nr:unnamed protein product [Dicrocoelium dendriticum]